jgi:hypothetical protein
MLCVIRMDEIAGTSQSFLIAFINQQSHMHSFGYFSQQQYKPVLFINYQKASAIIIFYN